MLSPLTSFGETFLSDEARFAVLMIILSEGTRRTKNPSFIAFKFFEALNTLSCSQKRNKSKIESRLQTQQKTILKLAKTFHKSYYFGAPPLKNGHLEKNFFTGHGFKWLQPASIKLSEYPEYPSIQLRFIWQIL